MAQGKLISPISRKAYERTKVAAYCRVSSNSADQLNSYAAQIQAYTKLIKSNAAWELVEIFADEGLSGMKAGNRVEFQRMIGMCEHTFEEAAAAKEARQRNQIVSECEGIALMQDRIRCGQCGAPMARHICSKRKVKESWTCSNDICGCRVRIGDTDLLVKVTLILNRIIENADLMAPKPKMRFKESLAVQRLQNEIDNEFTEEQPSEKLIVSRICEIASQLYKETNAREQIAARIAQKRVMLMNPQTEFNSAYFTDLVESVILEAPTRVSLLTKTAVQISEGEPDHGSQENTEEDSNTD